MNVVVTADVDAMAGDSAGRVVAAAGDAIRDRDVFTFVLAGGSTPAALYELLASPHYLSQIDWARTQVFFGDERCVAPHHEWSNYAMAQRTLLARVQLPPQNVHRIRGELPADDAAIAYADSLRQALLLDNSPVPRFDLILLGMGDDGHTASLFPGMPALRELNAWVASTAVPGYVRPQVARVTLTFPVLNAARQILFLVAGDAKAVSVRKVIREPAHDPTAAGLPAAQVRPYDGVLTWLLDEPAASLLRDG
jgi:6-phosphogluconolactonase